MTLAAGLVVLLLPGLGRLLLGHILVFLWLASGPCLLVALRRFPPHAPWRLDPFRAEALLGVGVAVLLGDLGLRLRPWAMEIVAVTAALGGVLLALGACRLPRLPSGPGRAWLALPGLVSLISGGELGLVAAGLALRPEWEVWLPGRGAATYGALAAVLMAWFPVHAILCGTAQLALSARLLAATWPVDLAATARPCVVAAAAVAVSLAGMLYAYSAASGVFLVLGAAAGWRLPRGLRGLSRGG